MQENKQPPGYVDSRYLDRANTYIRPLKQHSYELMRVRQGQKVLDLGCGVGVDTLGLAELVGPSGRVFGVDMDPDMVDEANRRARQAGLEGVVTHQRGDASALPFAEGCFDACRAERILMHLQAPALAVAELGRVLKPGGWLVLVEPDWGSASVASKQAGIERRLARIRAEQFLRSGYAGRELYQWMRQAGFQELAVEIAPLWWSELALMKYLTALDRVEAFALDKGLISHDELEGWRSELREMDERGGVFASLNIVTVAGRKPGPA